MRIERSEIQVGVSGWLRGVCGVCWACVGVLGCVWLCGGVCVGCWVCGALVVGGVGVRFVGGRECIARRFIIYY